MKKLFIILMLLPVCHLHAQECGEQIQEATKDIFTDNKKFDAHWRGLMAEGEYEKAAMNLEYAALSKNIQVSNKQALWWHAGQMWAMMGEYNHAKMDIKYTYNVFYKLFGSEDAKTWYYYAKGTIAFLDGDKAQLEKIMNKWERKYDKDKNYVCLQQLMDNWGQDYALATSTN